MPGATATVSRTVSDCWGTRSANDEYALHEAPFFRRSA